MVIILIIYLGTAHLEEKPEEADLVMKEHGGLINSWILKLT